MTSRILHYLHQHAIATAAFVCAILALASSSYAAFTISGSEIRNHTINPIKLNPRYINGSVRAWAVVGANGNLIAGGGGPRVSLLAGDPGGYGIKWRVKVHRCATNVTVDSASSPATETVPVIGNPSAMFTAGYAVGATSGPHNISTVQTFNQQGTPTPLAFDVTVVC